MRMSAEDLIDLLLTRDYYLLQRKDDRNREDIRIKREDGLPAEIRNYPYRLNQMPAYLFDKLLRGGVLRQDGLCEEGGTIYRVCIDGGKSLPKAA